MLDREGVLRVLNALMLYGWGLSAAGIRSEIWRDRLSTVGIILALGSAAVALFIWLCPKSTATTSAMDKP